MARTPGHLTELIRARSLALVFREGRGERLGVHHLLPALPCDAAGEAAEPLGGHQEPAVDLHQVLPGESRGQLEGG